MGGIAEQLHARSTILQRENDEIKSVLAAQKERESGKRKILKGVRLVTTRDIVKALEDAEAATKAKPKKSKNRKRKREESTESDFSQDEGNHNDEEPLVVRREQDVTDRIYSSLGIQSAGLNIVPFWSVSPVG